MTQDEYWTMRLSSALDELAKFYPLISSLLEKEEAIEDLVIEVEQMNLEISRMQYE